MQKIKWFVSLMREVGVKLEGKVDSSACKSGPKITAEVRSLIVAAFYSKVDVNNEKLMNAVNVVIGLDTGAKQGLAKHILYTPNICNRNALIFPYYFPSIPKLQLLESI